MRFGGLCPFSVPAKKEVTMNSRGSAKKLDPQVPAKKLDVEVEALCRLLAQILTRILSQQGVDKKAA